MIIMCFIKLCKNSLQTKERDFSLVVTGTSIGQNSTSKLKFS